MTDTEHDVEIGDVLITDYGRMKIVDIETEPDGRGLVDCRAVDDEGRLIQNDDWIATQSAAALEDDDEQ